MLRLCKDRSIPSQRILDPAFYLPARLFPLVFLFGTRCSSAFTSPAVFRFRVFIVAVGNKAVASLGIGRTIVAGSVVWRCGLRFDPRVFRWAHKCFQTKPLHRTRRPLRVLISRLSNDGSAMASRTFSVEGPLFVVTASGGSATGGSGSDCFSSTKSGRCFEWVSKNTRVCVTFLSCDRTRSCSCCRGGLKRVIQLWEKTFNYWFQCTGNDLLVLGREARWVWDISEFSCRLASTDIRFWTGGDWFCSFECAGWTGFRSEGSNLCWRQVSLAWSRQCASPIHKYCQ